MKTKNILDNILTKKALAMAKSGHWYLVIYIGRNERDGLKVWSNETVFHRSWKQGMPPIHESIARIEVEVHKAEGLPSHGPTHTHISWNIMNFPGMGVLTKRCSYEVMLNKAGISERELLGLLVTPLEMIQAKRNAD